jgi:hypothetical protein
METVRPPKEIDEGLPILLDRHSLNAVVPHEHDFWRSIHRERFYRYEEFSDNRITALEGEV